MRDGWPEWPKQHVHVVWAHHKFFFLSFHLLYKLMFFFLLLGSNLLITSNGRDSTPCPNCHTHTATSHIDNNEEGETRNVEIRKGEMRDVESKDMRGMRGK